MASLLPRNMFQPIWGNDVRIDPKKIPIYHVHGYVPFEKKGGSNPEDIIFTEDQYNRVANAPYSWSNLTQLQLEKIVLEELGIEPILIDEYSQIPEILEEIS